MSEANWLSNGLGGQSMYLLYLAAQKIIPATLSITADTGSERDRLCSTGERMSAGEFFMKYVAPYADRHGIEPIMVRAKDKNGQPLPDLIDVLRATEFQGDDLPSISVPLYTNDRKAGQLRQACTDKWKVRAIHQEARRRGIKLLRSAIGFHCYEADRIKAEWMERENGFDIYKPYEKRNELTAIEQTNLFDESTETHIKRTSRLTTIKWLEHYYPLIDLGLSREQIRAELDKISLPYLITTECDHCPHQDYPRWAAHSPEVIRDLVQIESKWNGKLFFTDRRIPLDRALEEMREEYEKKKRQGSLHDVDFGCESGAYCGI